jgi:hypothetical protein
VDYPVESVADFNIFISGEGNRKRSGWAKKSGFLRFLGLDRMDFITEIFSQKVIFYKVAHRDFRNNFVEHYFL